MSKIKIRLILKHETLKVLEMVNDVFNGFVKKTMTDEGVCEFIKSAENYILNLPSDHFILVAEIKGEICGMIDVRDNFHLCLFFVHRKFQGRGIGKKLFKAAINECLKRDPHISKIDVNSAVNAVGAYESLGFKTVSGEKMINGIRFVPMEICL